MAERFAREAPTFQPLPKQPYDPSHQETRRVAWDGYVDVRGNHYSVPATLVGQAVQVRISLDDELRVYAADQLAATHHLQSLQQGWVTVSDHHTTLWRAALQVEACPLTVYEEVGQWS